MQAFKAYSRIHGNKSVNVVKALEVGSKILASMEGITVSDYTFKHYHQIVPLDTKSAIEVEGVTVQIDPLLLFQKLTLA